MIKKKPLNKRNTNCRFNELTLSNMELRVRIQMIGSELKSLKANIKNDIDNIKYIMAEHVKIFNDHTHAQSSYGRTCESDIIIYLIK